MLMLIVMQPTRRYASASWIECIMLYSRKLVVSLGLQLRLVKDISQLKLVLFCKQQTAQNVQVTKANSEGPNKFVN